jgi:hypothetical protein
MRKLLSTLFLSLTLAAAASAQDAKFSSPVAPYPQGGGGPGQTALAGVLRKPWVYVYPPAVSGGVWVPYAPTGAVIPTAGTHTSGWQEALDYAKAHNYNVYFAGGQEASHPLGCKEGCGALVAHVESGYSINLPPSQGRAIVSEADTINCQGADRAACVTVDTCMMCYFDFRATQIVSNARAGAAVLLFDPHSPVPLDRLVGVTPALVDSYFFFHTVFSGFGGPAAADHDLVRFDLTNGHIRKNRFHFVEPNGGNLGLHVNTTAANRKFDQNTITFDDLHLQRNTAIKVGNGVSGDAFARNNKWYGNIDQVVGDVRGVDTYGKYDQFYLGLINAGTNSLYLEASEEGNQFFVGSRSGAVFKQAGNTHRSREYRAGQKMTTTVPCPSSPCAVPNLTLMNIRVNVAGGAVSSISRYFNDGGAKLDEGRTAGTFELEPGDVLYITYGAAPTVRRTEVQ